jgi:thioredoxin-like negative regulator of GroEL
MARLAWLLGLIILLIAGLWLLSGSPAALFPAEVSQQEIERALRDFRQLHRREPNREELMLTLAENLLRRNQGKIALACVEQIPTQTTGVGTAARRLQAQISLRLNQLGGVEQSVRKLLEAGKAGIAADPADLRLAQEMLVFVLSLEFRFEERRELLQAIRNQRPLDVLLAKQLYFPSLLAWKSQQQNRRLQEFLAESPGDPHITAAHARYLTSAGRVDESREIVNAALTQNPGHLGLLAAALECRFEQQSWGEFETLLAAAPPFDPGEPWLLTQMRAESALRADERTLAEKYVRHLLAADPTNPQYCHSMALLSGLAGRQEERHELQQRALTLAELRLTLAEPESDAGALRAISTTAEKLGLADAARDFDRLAKEAAEATLQQSPNRGQQPEQSGRERMRQP